MSSHDLVSVLEQIGQPRILVLGDLILDRYTWGDAERISQEAPVLVLRAGRREARLGGAANVANMLAGLEGRVAACGVVGDDAAGAELRRLLVASGADCELVLDDPRRQTSVKERFVGLAGNRHPSQILRVDHECREPLCDHLEAQLIENLLAQISRFDAVLVSDYGKGCCTPRLLRAVIDAARDAGVLVMVDPSRDCPLDHYRGASVIKPNRVETEVATGQPISQPQDALAAGRRLCQDLAAEMALITLDRDGMMLVSRDGRGELFPTQARNVYDIAGAGDMVLAVVGLALAAGTSAADAVRLGNVAAGLEVERSGVAVVYRDEIRAELLAGRGRPAQKIVTHDEAARLAADHRRNGQRVVFTNGCFDLLHVGHVTYLSEAAALGNCLFVAVNSDASVRRLKGAGRPVIGEGDRAALLAALASVDYVVVFDDDTPHELLEAIRPDVLVKGGTYTTDRVVGHEVVEAYGGTVCVTRVVDGISTTHILASLARGETAGSQGPAAPEADHGGPFSVRGPAKRMRRAG